MTLTLTESVAADGSCGLCVCRRMAISGRPRLVERFTAATMVTSDLALVAVGTAGESPGIGPRSAPPVPRRNPPARLPKIWYPIWDEGLKLDHLCARSKALGSPPRPDTATSLLTIRHLAGDGR